MALFGKKDEESAATATPRRSRAETGDKAFLPARHGRRGIESVFMRLIATGGIVGIGVALAAILGSQDIAAWIIGLAVAVVSVVLAAVLWSTRTL